MSEAGPNPGRFDCLEGLTTAEAESFLQLAKQIIAERGDGLRPRLSAVGALESMQDHEVISMIELVAGTLGEGDERLLFLEPTAGSTPSHSGSEAGDMAADEQVRPTTLTLHGLRPEDSVYNIRELLDAGGFAGLYDFLYVPFGDHEAAVGMGKVNFVAHDVAEAFRQAVAGQAVGTGFHATWAFVQGSDANLIEIRRFHASGRHMGLVSEKVLPWSFQGVDHQGNSLGYPVSIEMHWQ
mmetsp:Transcript_17037/g.37499  ORF Transcript_17037/g.37499 Transcript_17037/m.37499 type:complete len:239 (-) Transcript_17037:456-1172(-)